MKISFRKTSAEVDAQYREHEDYVFHDMKYGKARVWCWTSAGVRMTAIALDYAAKDYAAKEQSDAALARVLQAAHALRLAQGRPSQERRAAARRSRNGAPTTTAASPSPPGTAIALEVAR